jgi:hypothetical protein
MLPRKMPAVLVLLLALVFLSAAKSAGAQAFDFDKGRVALTIGLNMAGILLHSQTPRCSVLT